MTSQPSKSIHIAILHIRHAWTGGAERFINYLSKYLCENGHRVTIICRKHEEAPHPSVDFVVLKPFFIGDAHKIYVFGKAVEKHLKVHQYDVVFGFNRTWTQDIYRMGGGCHQTYLENAHRFIRPLWKDIINLEFIKNRVILGIERKALAPTGSKTIVVNSNLTKKDIVQRYGVDEARIRVIYNGVEATNFNPDNRFTIGKDYRRNNAIEQDDFVVLFLGTGYGRKGLDLVIKVFPTFLRSLPSAKLLVVGEDSRTQDYQNWVKSLGISDSVLFKGGTRNPAECYAASDLYVIPTHHDPFANSTIEAMASGLPVITSTSNGACELISEKQDGSVIDLKQNAENALLDAMIYWSDKTNNERGRKAARLLAEQHSVQGKMQQVLELIEIVFEQNTENRIN